MNLFQKKIPVCENPVSPSVSTSSSTLATLGLIALSSASAMAGTLIVKPGTLNTFAPEFARTLARSSNYTVAAALQETVLKPGETVFQNLTITQQGAVYLFNDNSNAVERVYQFPGNDHLFLHAGSQVAISEKWLAFTSTNNNFLANGVGEVYIVGKTNGQWTQCPTVSGILDCTPMVGLNGTAPVKPIVKILLPRSTQWLDMKIAISDNTLAIADIVTSQLAVFRYQATTGQWKQEFFLDDLDDKHLGTGLAIEGDRIAVSSTFSNANEPGYVRILQRNATAGTWSFSGLSYGSFTNGGFGNYLSMQGGNLVVSGGGVLAFYKVGTDGSLPAPFLVNPPASTGELALSGNTVAVTTSDTSKPVVIYKRDSVGNTNSWKATSSLDGHLYASQNYYGYSYYGINQIGLSGNNLSLGWHSYGLNKDNTLIGAFIREKVSLIDACKTPGNLVQNCSFDLPNSTAWQLLTWQGASAFPTYVNGEMKTTINYAGTDMWHIQARTSIALPAAQAYTLKFRAKTSTSRTVVVNLGHNGSQDNNWTSYGRVTANLGPNMTEYSFDLPNVPADANAILDFNMGNAGTQPVTLDGVSLTKRP